ncbi:MAG: septum formation initiator family protein [Desulfomonilia bacterium]|jgi:cell division protein FtsB|nr:septum formation initiator family protein [Deltaproteobacteria bacterium]MDX9761753.1 septum formation initiator family protein [Desulfomonilia bacterium]
MRISRPVVYALILITVLFLSLTIPGDKGLIRSYQLYQELRQLKTQNVSLQVKNESLAQEALMLKENLAYIEHVIVQEMNLVRPGDKIVVFKKEKK